MELADRDLLFSFRWILHTLQWKIFQESTINPCRQAPSWFDWLVRNGTLVTKDGTCLGEFIVPVPLDSLYITMVKI